MTPLKADRIAAAYSKLRISGLTVNPNPSDLELALGELESMMSELAARGIKVGYNFEQQPDPNSDLGVPQEFWNMVTCNLAVRLISDFNKEPPMTLFNQASQSLSVASGICARNQLRNVQYPSRQPIGSGNRRFERWQRFYAQFNELPPNKPDTLEIMQGETNDFKESFEAYLRTDEAISTFAVTCDNGLIVVSSALNVADVDYRLSAPSDLAPSIWQQVKIRIETTEGRVEIRIRNFQVTPYVRVGDQNV
ncbi:hypothetical protein H7A76_30295 [Pseudomonas sp. MSSRFD41]|uniref:packaged DNA stabilization gp4 family protein n=1 Tax=Pseudomonas sp. MSSRFD41 TaxID=1310370 RepID=UPI001639EF3A|nr:packaged DNA stabilization gp4 family protein [Pseudomonas sp. MSSRFD41]MBC2659745.1 hypothetical protein [Pseudomonas sp. MSSRFD41]